MIRFKLTPGAAKAANGMQKQVLASFATGQPITTQDGADLTVTLSVEAGIASGS